jgi:hypothetical protein
MKERYVAVAPSDEMSEVVEAHEEDQTIHSEYEGRVCDELQMLERPVTGEAGVSDPNSVSRAARAKSLLKESRPRLGVVEVKALGRTASHAEDPIDLNSWNGIPADADRVDAIRRRPCYSGHNRGVGSVGPFQVRRAQVEDVLSERHSNPICKKPFRDEEPDHSRHEYDGDRSSPLRVEAPPMGNQKTEE